MENHLQYNVIRNLANNNLEGPIPKEISSCTALNKL